jgi:nicotinate-nucleotide adenylyltransferase
MIRRAIEPAAGWEASDLELGRSGPSYSFDTLTALHRAGLTPLQLFFITGADAFAEIATWHRYPELLDAAHFAVVARPGLSLDLLRERVPSLTARMIAPAQLTRVDAPRIILIESNTPDVSSTDIRHRAASGESLDGLVPPAVAAYIEQNQLYRGTTIAPVASAFAANGATADKPVAPDPLSAPDRPDASSGE